MQGRFQVGPAFSAGSASSSGGSSDGARASMRSISRMKTWMLSYAARVRRILVLLIVAQQADRDPLSHPGPARRAAVQGCRAEPAVGVARLVPA